jgi:hypothetical protein
MRRLATFLHQLLLQLLLLCYPLQNSSALQEQLFENR